MSFMPIKSSTSIAGKRSFFSRTSSIQKLKCSATHPFRLAGTKFSKDAIKQLFEALITRARLLSQQIFINLCIGAFKLLSISLSFWKDNESDKEACDNTELQNNSRNISNFYERLLQKIHKLEKHKECFKLIKAKDSLSLASKTHLCSNDQVNYEKNIIFQKENIKLEKTLTEKNKITFKSTSTETTLLTTTNDGAIIPKKNNILISLVYSSAIFIYLQLFTLSIALYTIKRIPPGLIFLIISLFLIAVIVFKVLVVDKSEKYEYKYNGQHNEKAKSNTNDSSKSTKSTSRKIPAIDFNSKTLSKIKIL